jgi:hypothetical protein
VDCEITRETEWRSIRGDIVKFEDMEDSHLMNVFAYLVNKNKKMSFSSKTRDKMILILGELILERGLNPTCESEPYYKDGLWYYYDEMNDRHIEIVGERKLSKNICKKCRSSESVGGQRPWCKNDEKIWKERGVVFCYMEVSNFQNSSSFEIPKNCPYKLEQIVLGDKK